MMSKVALARAVLPKTKNQVLALTFDDPKSRLSKRHRVRGPNQASWAQFLDGKGKLSAKSGILPQARTILFLSRGRQVLYIRFTGFVYRNMTLASSA
jgi:hypothetical protein